MTSGRSFTRRSFLKGAATAAVGTVVFTGCVSREFVPSGELTLSAPVLMPEDLVEGQDNWYATLSRTSGAGDGLIVRVMQGRAKKIEGNPDYPINLGKHSAADEYVLQVLYHPDRVKAPMRRSGDRGSGQFTQITWDEALNEVRQALQEARDAGQPGNVIALTEPARGHQALIVDRFVRGLGGEVFTYDPLDQSSLAATMRDVFGVDRLPEFDIAGAQFILNFGADFLGTWLSPVHYARQYGVFRQGQIGAAAARPRGTLVHIEPRFSLTAANADQWIPNKPGSEGILALSIAQVLLSEGLIGPEAAGLVPDAAALDAFAPENVTEATGVPADRIREIARALGTQRPALVIGGGPAGAQTNGSFNLQAIYALNLLIGSVGQPGGIRFNPPSPIPDLATNRFGTPTASWQQLADRLRSGQPPVAVALIHNANPVYGLPEALGFREALSQAQRIISFSSFVDETTALADLILPDHSPLEAWGTDVPEPGPGFPVVGFQQPVVRPVYDTRSFGDVLLVLAEELGGPLAEDLPWNTLRDAIRDGAQQLQALGSGTVQEANFDRFWTMVLQRGGWWDDQAAAPAAGQPTQPVLPTQPEQPSFAGEGQYRFHLIPFESVGLRGGELAHVPWAQSTPDPLTTVVWQSWVEINPQVAEELQIQTGDLVEIESPNGTITVPAVIFPAAPPDVLAIPVGQGHESYTRYAQNRGANPLKIVAPQFDAKTGALAWGATRVNLRKTGQSITVPMIQNSILPVRQLEDVPVVPTVPPNTVS